MEHTKYGNTHTHTGKEKEKEVLETDSSRSNRSETEFKGSRVRSNSDRNSVVENLETQKKKGM